MLGFRKKFLVLFACALCCFCAVSARADTFTLINTDSGRYDDRGFHDSTNKNYLAGSVTDNNNTRSYRNFFVFDLSGVSGSITSARLQLFTNIVSGSGSYSVFDVTTPVSGLTAFQTGRADIFADLGSGVGYGSTTITRSDLGSLITVDLNAEAIAALQSSAGRTFVLGGFFDAPQGTFAFSGTSLDSPDLHNQLILQTQPNAAVPEPATLLLLVTGLGAVGATVRQRRKLANR